MGERSDDFATVDEYISLFPPQVAKKLSALRQTILKAAPKAQEKIAYRMPAYTLCGPLVYFAAFKNHIGFYPTPAGTETFAERLSAYKTSKGAIQLPLNKPLPLDLIREIVQFRAVQNAAKTAAKKKR